MKRSSKGKYILIVIAMVMTIGCQPSPENYCEIFTKKTLSYKGLVYYTDSLLISHYAFEAILTAYPSQGSIQINILSISDNTAFDTTYILEAHCFVLEETLPNISLSDFGGPELGEINERFGSLYYATAQYKYNHFSGSRQ